MKEQLENIIKRFQNSQTSLESYQVISDFMETILKIKNFQAFDNEIERERETISKAREEMKNYSNEFQNRQNIILHQMDTNFYLRNLNDVRFGLQSINQETELFLDNNYWMFRRFNPDEPMPESDKLEYNYFMNKVFKKVLPFLESIDDKPNSKIIKVKFYDKDKRVLVIGNYEISIAKNEGNNNTHEIMSYILIDKIDYLKDKRVNIGMKTEHPNFTFVH